MLIALWISQWIAAKGRKSQMSIQQRRTEQIAESIARIREIESDLGVNLKSIDKIKAEVISLAKQKALFPVSEFHLNPETEGSAVIYRLSEDADHRFALYASVGMPGKSVRPHNHTTWAVIAGVAGDELNRFYKRTDDGSVAGEGTVEQYKEENVCYGTGVAFMPDDIHSIHVRGEVKTVHLHMYGLALDHLHERIMFNQEKGSYRTFPATMNFKSL
ncbi:MAG: putative metal-dependent enzyme (double-stranded beta helix superfamily) [Candidatus Azotimanducaceae bacterium]|jgi:predicted metal-dependent enzyme (double-stranded beta helix superfamily)